MRNESAVFLQIDADVKSPVTIPRLAAPLRSVHWSGKKDKAEVVTEGITLKPGIATWDIHWKERPDDLVLLDGKALLVLEFDAEPVLITETKPIEAKGDGSFYLPAHMATTTGEKVRYEPQPFKNTLGYWVGKTDSANWHIQLDEPGRFNVAVLQGCGKGQGGSQAMMTFLRPLDTKLRDATLEFEVVETGHFQNFQWVHLGEIELDKPGQVSVHVMPKQIKKAAMMDIRAIHLIRLPNK